ncbi:MAG TPA: hypothetical protein PK675_02765 [Clostridia bacterium]|nr:hypothetical protein [Clostridia bacterium]
MSRFYDRICYAVRYYLSNKQWIFVVNVVVCLGGAIFGIITKANIFAAFDTGDITVNVIITGGFGAVFWHCFFPNIILVTAAFFLGFNIATVWIIFILTFFRGIYIGGFCVLIWCLGFYGILFVIFYCIVQVAFCSFVLGLIYAYSLDNCKCSFRDADYKILLFLAVFTAVFCIIQSALVFLVPRAILII